MLIRFTTSTSMVAAAVAALFLAGCGGGSDNSGGAGLHRIVAMQVLPRQRPPPWGAGTRASRWLAMAMPARFSGIMLMNDKARIDAGAGPDADGPSDWVRRQGLARGRIVHERA